MFLLHKDTENQTNNQINPCFSFVTDGVKCLDVGVCLVNS